MPELALLRRARVDQVGSLLRPPALKVEFLRHTRGESDAPDLCAAQDAAISTVVARQEALRLPAVKDDEFRRLSWQVSFSEVEG